VVRRWRFSAGAWLIGFLLLLRSYLSLTCSPLPRLDIFGGGTLPFTPVMRNRHKYLLFSVSVFHVFPGENTTESRGVVCSS
jgi:hypothetical protein